jgi:hypothetical protein
MPRIFYSSTAICVGEWLQAGHSIHAGTFAYFGGERHADGLSEDIMFCADARALGKKIYACPWFHVGHIGSHEFVGHPIVSNVPGNERKAIP